MTADIVNLRKARKMKARAEAQKTALENSVKFGRSKAERAANSLRSDLDRKRLDGAVRDVTPDVGTADDDAGPGTVL